MKRRQILSTVIFSLTVLIFIISCSRVFAYEWKEEKQRIENQRDRIMEALSDEKGQKRLIILFDNTKSMESYGLREYYVKAMREIISKYLNPGDELLYMVFDNNVDYPFKNLFHKSNFITVTAGNKEKMQLNVIPSVSNDWGTNIRYAYKEALEQYVKAAEDDRTRRTFLIIFSDNAHDEIVLGKGDARQSDVDLFRDCYTEGGACYNRYEELVARCNIESKKEFDDRFIMVLGVGVTIIDDCGISARCDKLDNDKDGNIDEEGPDKKNKEEPDGVDDDEDGKIDEDFCSLYVEEVKPCDKIDNDKDGKVDEEGPDKKTKKEPDHVDDDGDGKVDEDYCFFGDEVCGNCTDDDGDKKIDEGCKRICDVKGADNDCDGTPDAEQSPCKVPKEKCCNCTDDDKDGRTDEGCILPCPCWLYIAIIAGAGLLLLVIGLLASIFLRRKLVQVDCDREHFLQRVRIGESVTIGGLGESDLARYFAQNGINENIAMLKKTLRGFKFIPLEAPGYTFLIEDIEQKGPCDFDMGQVLRIQHRKLKSLGIRVLLSSPSKPDNQ